MNRFLLQIYFIIFSVLNFFVRFSNELGSSCSRDEDCKIGQSVCISGVCACKSYHAPHNATTCLQSKFLDEECLIDEQCSLRVANSICSHKICQCSQGFVSFRKHTCLKPAKPGDVCYSEEHCQIYNENSHCRFVILDLFGKCVEEGNGRPGVTPEKISNETKNEESSEPEKNESTLENFEGENSKEETSIVTNTSHHFSYEKEDFESNSSNSLVKATKKPFQQAQHFNNTDENKYRLETDSNENEWEEMEGTSLGFPCRDDRECEKADLGSRCINGICDCAIKNNGTKSCGKENTGCASETFQCRRSGVCISWFFVCDGKKDCPDGSDEHCQAPSCPSLSFRCGSTGTCISLAALCDGIDDCPGGEDEDRCSPEHRNQSIECPANTFQCLNGQCLPKFEFCNAISKCGDGSDETLESCRFHYYNTEEGRRNPSQIRNNYCPFECANGQCRSTAILCTGRDGCGDNSDEINCSVCRCPKIPEIR